MTPLETIVKSFLFLFVWCWMSVGWPLTSQHQKRIIQLQLPCTIAMHHPSDLLVFSVWGGAFDRQQVGAGRCAPAQFTSTGSSPS